MWFGGILMFVSLVKSIGGIEIQIAEDLEYYAFTVGIVFFLLGVYLGYLRAKLANEAKNEGE